MTGLKRTLCRLLSLTLAFLMAFEASGNAFAYMVEGAPTAAQSDGQITLTDGDGSVTEVDESWEETYPYGAFAFEKSGLAVKEGESGAILVYRLGGTAGRATAYIKYQPTVTQDENGEPIYDFGISAQDVTVSVEEPQPAAKYQPVGKEPDPQETDAAVTASEGEDGWTLSVDVENAESYAWQVSENGGVWNDLDGADSASLPADAEALDERFDYRCVYTANGVRYCTDSLRGTEYVRAEEEVLAPMPEDIDLNADPVYTPLALTAEGEDPYGAWLFELVFADGEWVKELHIDALADDVSEAAEAAAFTIVGCEGGAVLDSASTLLLRIEDANEPEPGELGFTAELVSADKADGAATLMIRRTGGKSRPVTVKYRTADGTAMAGRDYAAAEGTLLFYGGIDELPVRVELIDDGVAADEAVEFSVELTELQGDAGCALAVSRAAVALTNSGTGAGENNATRLYDPDAVDLSGSVEERGTAASSADAGATVVSGEVQETVPYEPVYAELRYEDGEMTTQVYAGNTATILFRNPQANVWTDTVDLAANKGWWSVGNTRKTSLLGAGETTGKLGSGSKYTLPSGIALTSRDSTDATFNGWADASIGASRSSYVGQMFGQFRAVVRADTAHDTAYLHKGHYDYSYTKPNLQILQGSTLLKTPQNSARSGKGPLDKNWKIRSTDDWSNYYNPFASDHSGSFSVSGTDVTVKIEMHYAFDNGHTEHENDDLNDDTMLAVNSLVLTRRAFAQNAFCVEFSTPNDADTAPEGGTVLSDYASFVPKVELQAGGVQGENALYVGSRVRLTAGQAPAGYYLSDVIVYQRTDGGWAKFDKFGKSLDSDGATLELVGVNGALTADDLTAEYKFRVIYARETRITVDLSPSLPRDDSGAQLSDAESIAQVLNGYDGKSDHGFLQGATPRITYGTSRFGTEDYTAELLEADIAKDTLTDGKTTLTFRDTNIQWVNFGLSSKDLLLVNGRAYPGNADIYLRESDLSGGMTVYYYHEDYQNALSAMKTTISWMGVYWDGNGNGQIDGYFNDSGNFVLDGSGDEFCGYLDAGEYNETLFAPKKNADGVTCQYFLKVCYTMIPRCLSVPEGASAEEDRAQVMPAFLTALNADAPAYSKATDEQRQYRYLVSGKTRSSDGGSYDYSADNHLMYTEKATAKSIVDIPLGGDHSPAALTADGTAYTWTPDFRGALLYPYAAPAPITIENSVAGATEVTGDYALVYENGVPTGYTYTTDRGLDKMNGYLGSFTGSTTFALVTQEQQRSVGEERLSTATGAILAAVADGNTGNYAVRPDSVTLGGISTTPDAAYLKEVHNEADAGAASDVNMDDSGSSMSEFNVDLGINLGGTEIGVTDAVTILLDGNKVGFAVGVPLGGADSEEGVSGIGSANKDAWTQFSDFFDKSNFGGDDDYRGAKDSYKSAKSGGYKPDGSDFRSKGMGVEFSMSIAFMFEYNPLDDGFYFEGMTVSCAAEFSIRVQARLTVCPIVYFYMEFSAGIEATTGLGVIRGAVEGDPVIDGKSAADQAERVTLRYLHAPGSSNAIINEAAYEALTDKSGYTRAAENDACYWNSARFKTYEAAKAEYLDSRDYLLSDLGYGLLSETEKAGYTAEPGRGYYNALAYDSYDAALAAFTSATSYRFETNLKAFNLCFSGKLSVEVLNSDGSAAGGDYITGFLTSDGQSDTQIVLKKQEGMSLGETVTVVLRPMERDSAVVGDETQLSYLAPITEIRNEVYWKGIEITPSLGMEIGAGVGVELMKLELYAKVGLEATFLLGVYNEDYDGTNQKYKPASVESFEFSIGLGVRVVLLVFTFELDAATFTVEYDGSKWETGWHFLNDWVGQDSEAGYLGVTITPPKTYSAQRLYTAADNTAGELSTQAYLPADERVPFQLSGYKTNVNAFALGDGLLSGTAYKAVSAGGRSFLFYTVSRSGAASEDLPMLVMSELTVTGSGAYGLANPADADSETPYLIVDNDGTGDLDFDVWTEGSTVHAAWVSYASASAEQTSPAKPDGEPYQTADGTAISADNYKTIAAPEKPEDFTETEPAEKDYFTADGDPIDAKAHAALPEAEQAAYAETDGGKYQKYKPVGDYADYAAAKAAYDAAAVAYQEAKTAHDALTESYDAAQESYNSWKAYYESLASYNAWAQNRLAAAAKNTELKTASWSFRTTTKTVTDGEDAAVVTVYDSDAAFSAADKAANTGSHLFAPAAVGTDAVFFGSAYASDTDGKELEKYRSYLEKTQSDERVRNYLLQTEKSTLDVFGTQSALNAAFRDEDGKWTRSTMPLSANQTIGNIEVRRLDDGSYYVAYTTSVDCYESYGEGKADRFTEERLYLRRVTCGADGSVDWGTPYVLRVLRSYDAQTEKDGLYNAAGEQTKAFESPYFANLSFLRGRIDADVLAGETEAFSTYAAAAEHDLLLFEMNGTTYAILDDDLESITSSGSGAIRPFFTGADGQVSGKLEVTIGADAEGNLFAVYTGAVEGTTNNAIYLAAYDPAAGWSDGVILAMNGMDVHEQSAKNGWNEKLTQAAYWGLDGKGGLLTESGLEALFGAADGSAIYTALSAFDGAPLGNGRSVTLGALQAVAGAGEDLLILTQGTATKLALAADSSGKSAVVPAYRSDGTMDSTNGIYVIRYGRGEKALGEGSIAFTQADFSAGSALRVEAGAVNVGDTAFYGSAAQPITVTLSAAGQELLKSEISQNILPGQTVSISGTAAALQKDLAEGDEFVLTVSEYSGEGYDSGVSKALTLYTVDLRPDLGVEQLTLKNPVVSADGSTTTYEISFVAANRGSAAAEGVFAQFSYADGEDADGSTTYAALDLTLSGTALTVDREKSLAELSTQAASTDGELKAGILHLYSSEDSSESIRAGNGRRVNGSLTVPSRAFAAGEAGTLTLRVELFRDGDSVNSTFITQSFHDEHYTANNALSVSQSAVTSFTAAPSIVIPLGTTTLIPLSAVSSRGTKPSITVQEIDDEDGANIGILNFKESRAGGGRVSGVISITPANLGHGILHVYDTATNSLTAIAFEVADSSNGIDIYNDNESFTFYQADGTQYDRETSGADSDWSFTGASEWGQGGTKETPLRTNLSYGSRDASFRFQSVAERIDLYFQGEIEVSTTHPEVADTRYSGEGGSAFTTIELGSNPALDAQIVTIRVLSPNAAFDRLVEHYPGGVVPVPSFDRESPNLYWSRSFPATAAITAGSRGIPLRLYALDDGGVSYISVNGRQYTALDTAAVTQIDPDGRLLCYDFGTITENGTYEVAVADTSGNITRETLLVDWFGGTASGDAATVEVPEYDAGFFLGDAAAGGQHIGSKELESLTLRTEHSAGKEAVELKVLCFGEDGLETLTAGADGGYPIRKNAIYWVYATHTDGTYSSRFLCMSQIDTEIPAVSLRYDVLNGTLEWTAAKAGLSASPITSVTLGGKAVNTASGLKLSGSFATLYNGSYTLRAEDSAGNYSEQTIQVADAPLSIAGSNVQCIGAWNAERDNGAVELDLTGVTGGTWADALSDPANGLYRAEYEAALLPGVFDTAKLDEVTDWVHLTEGGNMTHRFSGLALGDYLLVVRDAAQPGRFTTSALTIAWEAIEAETAAVLASYASAEDGAVGVTVTNGRAANYEFAILTAPAGWDGRDLSIDTFLAAATAEAPLTWLPADNLYASALTRSFDGLTSGSYLVAVRGLAGASEDDLAALKRLGRTLREAQDALKKADSPTPEYRQELEDAVTAAQSAYDAAAAALSAGSEALYGTDTAAELWQRAIVLNVYVGFYEASSAKKSGTDENGSTVFELTPDKKLTATDSSKIYKENRENDVVLRRGGENVYLPVGTLPAGFDANRILVDAAASADGFVVQYTAPDGSVSIVPWCLVSEGRVSYFVLGPGDYELVPADCAFTDIAGLWGEDAIRFATHRGLLSGVGSGLFAPQGTMTRAMFVTVLWRMAGCPAAEGESAFTDLSADWYRAAVAWGAETGVVSGLSETEFGPNYPVTREQMCVLLCRFAEELGLNAGSGGAAAFSDAGDISPWAMDAVGVCAANGLVLGMGDNRFAPKNTAARMEVSALFTRFITRMVEKYAPAAE